MEGIDKNVITHALNVESTFTRVKQRECNMGPEKRKAIEEEVNKLSTANFNIEVKYPEWLAMQF